MNTKIEELLRFIEDNNKPYINIGTGEISVIFENEYTISVTESGRLFVENCNSRASLCIENIKSIDYRDNSIFISTIY